MAKRKSKTFEVSKFLFMFLKCMISNGSLLFQILTDPFEEYQEKETDHGPQRPI